MAAVEALFAPARIGRLDIKNRFVRSATSETMSTDAGEITDAYEDFYRALARGGAGLILTGHMFVHPRGRYIARQSGLHDDRVVPRLRRFTQTMHEAGATVFAELGHAGSQCRDPGITPLAPSVIPNFISERDPQEMNVADIEEAIAAFGTAARRAREAGFDGVHVHAGHGYLISEFSSPWGNRRTDAWGGDAERRGRFLLEIYRSIRRAVGADFPVTVKLGMADSMESGGLELAESLGRAAALVAEGVDAIETSVGIMHLLTKSVGRFVGVGWGRAFQDMVLPRFVMRADPEAYFRPSAHALKRQHPRLPVILVGGIRRTETMADILASGDADFISMARPLIREPDLPNQIMAGRRGLVDCVSCNICVDHEGTEPTRCWRTDKRLIVEHLYRKYWSARGGH
ncbi:MAG: NADH:flavin oxidoreductase [Alphaproteobacteria bacterium]|nr:NADH:flavin oxidoreductase [Alphaproteobacteria bacterium]